MYARGFSVPLKTSLCVRYRPAMVVRRNFLLLQTPVMSRSRRFITCGGIMKPLEIDQTPPEKLNEDTELSVKAPLADTPSSEMESSAQILSLGIDISNGTSPPSTTVLETLKENTKVTTEVSLAKTREFTKVPSSDISISDTPGSDAAISSKTSLSETDILFENAASVTPSLDTSLLEVEMIDKRRRKLLRVLLTAATNHGSTEAELEDLRKLFIAAINEGRNKLQLLELRKLLTAAQDKGKTMPELENIYAAWMNSTCAGMPEEQETAETQEQKKLNKELLAKKTSAKMDSRLVLRENAKALEEFEAKLDREWWSKQAIEIRNKIPLEELSEEGEELFELEAFEENEESFELEAVEEDEELFELEAVEASQMAEHLMENLPPPPEFPSIVPSTEIDALDPQTALTLHMSLLSHTLSFSTISSPNSSFVQSHELKSAPIFTGNAKFFAEQRQPDTKTFPQYGLFAAALDLVEGKKLSSPKPLSQDGVVRMDPRIFINGNAPLSAFICGLQGSGKSHTLSCMIENFLLPTPTLGRLPNPLTGLVFHFDKYTSTTTVRPCEAAYLASHVPVTVFVSATNLGRMKRLYSSIPGKYKPIVKPLKFCPKDLNIERMLALMAVSQHSENPPLYMETVRRILRDLAGGDGGNGVDYHAFKNKLRKEKLNKAQKNMLKMRLDLLESFMEFGEREKWSDEIRPGGLVVVDLSDPFVDEGTACSLFDMSLSLFLEGGAENGIVIALDEAHKYMSKHITAADKFTQTLLAVIRLQRHLGARVIVSTQEPTVSPRLLDLCSVTVVHRFTSPEWLEFLKQHIAVVRKSDKDLMQMILDLGEGEACVFAPSGVLAGGEFGEEDGEEEKEESRDLKKLGGGFLRVKVRRRITVDGGQSQLAERKNFGIFQES